MNPQIVPPAAQPKSALSRVAGVLWSLIGIGLAIAALVATAGVLRRVIQWGWS